MVADANQLLEKLGDFSWAGDDDLARKFIGNKNLFVSCKCKEHRSNRTANWKDILSASLIRVVDNAELQ